MRGVMYRDIEIDICSNCSSVWFDTGEYHLLSKSLNKKAKERWYDGVDPIALLVDFISSDSTLPCYTKATDGVDILEALLSSLLDNLL